MLKYVVQWTYKSSNGGPWGAGAVVSVDEDVAKAINRSSPGVLIPFVPEPEPTPKPEVKVSERAPKAPAKDRQMVGQTTRHQPVVKEEPIAVEEKPEEPKPVAKKEPAPPLPPTQPAKKKAPAGKYSKSGKRPPAKAK